MPISKKSLQLAIKACKFYASAFYGWSAKIHESDRLKFEEYRKAITEFNEELESRKTHGKNTIRKSSTK